MSQYLVKNPKLDDSDDVTHDVNSLKQLCKVYEQNEKTKSQVIDTLKQQLRQCGLERDKNYQELWQQDAHIKSIESKLEQKQEHIESIESELKQKQEHIESFESELKQKLKQLELKEKYIESIESQLQETKKKLQTLECGYRTPRDPERDDIIDNRYWRDV
jgi:chromosome segregation ATPase